MKEEPERELIGKKKPRPHGVCTSRLHSPALRHVSLPFFFPPKHPFPAGNKWDGMASAPRALLGPRAGDTGVKSLFQKKTSKAAFLIPFSLPNSFTWGFSISFVSKEKKCCLNPFYEENNPNHLPSCRRFPRSPHQLRFFKSAGVFLAARGFSWVALAWAWYTTVGPCSNIKAGKILGWGKKRGGWLGCRQGLISQWDLDAATLVLVFEGSVGRRLGSFQAFWSLWNSSRVFTRLWGSLQACWCL